MKTDPRALAAVMHENELMVYLLSRYINETPRLIDEEAVRGIMEDCRVDEEEAYLSLLSAAIGLDTVEQPSHRLLERNYLRRGLVKCEPTEFEGDTYRKTIRFPTASVGKWKFVYTSYAPYEPFACGHPMLTRELREIPRLGYFDKSFPFPAVEENGVEWMSLKPNELLTMKEPLSHAHGRVLTLGLGLGYFAFHASEKNTVESVTVIERDPDVIKLFREHLLPQMPHGDKITVLEADAMAYMQTSDLGRLYDVLFADLWHDASDGLPLYLRLKKCEQTHGIKSCDYWIEPSILSLLRRLVYERITDEAHPLPTFGIDPVDYLSDEFLKKLACTAELQ